MDMPEWKAWRDFIVLLLSFVVVISLVVLAILYGAPKKHHIPLPSDIKRLPVLWPNGRIPCVLHKEALEKWKRQRIVKAMKTIEEQTKGIITFVRRETYDVDHIFVTDRYYCNSVIGRGKGRQILSLGDGCQEMGQILHELVHVIGFDHEQSRFDRDNYIKVHVNNIQKAKLDQFDKKMTYNQVIDPNYSFDTIMHYTKDAFAINKDNPTMEVNLSEKAKQQIREKGMNPGNIYLPENVHTWSKLPEIDVKRIRKLYRTNRNVEL